MVGGAVGCGERMVGDASFALLEHGDCGANSFALERRRRFRVLVAALAARGEQQPAGL